MNPSDYYFELLPCDNGWNVKQFEWTKDGKYEKTRSMLFYDLDDVMVCLRSMLADPKSYLKQYD